MKDFSGLRLRLQSLTIFRGLLDSTALGRFHSLLEFVDRNGSREGAVGHYAEFARELYRRGGNWTEYLLNAALEEENLYVLRFTE